MKNRRKGTVEVEKEFAFRRHSTKFPGVYYRWGTHHGTGKPEKIYYIAYWRGGKKIEEKAGREKQDDMTASRAAGIRAKKIEGEPSRRERREAERVERAAEEGRWTFDRLWEEWKTVNEHKKGRVNDDNRYRTHLKDLFGDKEPREVLPLDVDRLRVKMLKASAPPPGRRRKEPILEKKPYAIGTVKSVLSLLARIANFGMKRQLCEGLRFKVEGPKGAKQKTEDMTEEQMSAYIKVCREWPDPQAGNFQLLELYTGMRRSEVRNLKWSDVDFERGFILIRDPKSGEDQRVPMSNSAAELLRAHPREAGNPFVFAGERGGGARGLRRISETSRAIRRAAGLPDSFRPNHGLRHAFASHLASSGVDLYTLQRLLTHKSPLMTQRYAHLRDETLRRGAEVMSRIVREASSE